MFTQKNTQGYTDDQLAELNRQWDAIVDFKQQVQLALQELLLWRHEVLIENARPHAHRAIEILVDVVSTAFGLSKDELLASMKPYHEEQTDVRTGPRPNPASP